MDPAAELKELLLRTPPWSVATAESLTAGHIQALISSISGSSHYFRGGLTAYTLDQKVRHLGVDRATAEKCNCVSRDIAEQMARGACALFQADLAVATTGYAEPDETREVRVPHAWWAVAHLKPDGQFVVCSNLVKYPDFTRTEVQSLVARKALAELIAYVRSARTAG